MALTRYRGLVFDSSRWDAFEHRAGDIVITTPPKCGTTWTQMILALLVFQDAELPARLALLSPWLDNLARARRDVVADLDAQSHRRFIKTHTPLDGLPRAEGVTYVCVGRDPRDVAISMANHMDNLDLEQFGRARAAAAAIDAIDGVDAEPAPLPPPPSRDDPAAWFWSWVGTSSDVRPGPTDLAYTMRHLSGFWSAPPDVDVVWLHYDDLRADLEGQMRALAQRLGIEVPEARWPALVDAATLESMRRDADRTAPGVADQWRDPAKFFRAGSSGQWRDLLDDEGVQRYAERVRSLGPPDLVQWLHHADPLP